MLFSRRNAPGGLALALVFAGLCFGQQRDLTVLHFNDLHAALSPDDNGRGGLAYLATAIREQEKNCTSCILVSAGDLVQGTPVSTIFRGTPVYEIVNMLRLDASTLGNHDFDYGWREVARQVRKAKFPTVSSGIADGRGKLFSKPYIILKKNGLRVGVMGVMTESLPSLTTPETRGPWRTLPLIETIHKYAAELRGKTDVIVLLAHLTPEEEDKVLHEATEIPVVISGHVHIGLAEPKTVGGRVLVRAWPSARELGRLELKVDPSRRAVTSSTWKHIRIDPKSFAPAPDVAKKVAQWEAKVTKVVDTPIGEAKRAFIGPELKALIERATAEEMGTDFAFMNRGGVRAPLPAGPLLARHVWMIYPFDNRVVIGKFKGKDLPAVVTQGKTIDPEREYTLAVSDFTAANQDSPSQLASKGLQFPKTGPLHRDLLIEWIKRKKVVE